jgi:Polyketide cyclase / dehydrase and lipid transport
MAAAPLMPLKGDVTVWESEFSVEAQVAPESVWQVWADFENAASWNEGIESIELRGPFASGTEFLMKPAGREAIVMQLAAVAENVSFAEVAEANGLTIRIIHRLERLDGQRTRIVYRTEITGEGADELGPHLGPGVTSAFPDAVAKLVELARRRESGADGPSLR